MREIHIIFDIGLANTQHNNEYLLARTDNSSICKVAIDLTICADCILMRLILNMLLWCLQSVVYMWFETNNVN